jgi:hypothetical protein
MAIEAGLAALPDIEVVGLDRPTVGRLMALDPILIVSERNADDGFARTLVNSDLPLIELDTSEFQVRVFSARRVPLAGIDDLLELIGQVVAGEPIGEVE